MKKNISYALVATLALFAMSASAQTAETTASSDVSVTTTNVGAPMVPPARNTILPIPGARPIMMPIRAENDDARNNNVRVERKEVRADMKDAREAVQSERKELRADIKDAREEMQGDRKEMRAENVGERKEMRADIKNNRIEARGDIKELRLNNTAAIKEMRGEVKLMMASGTPIQIKEMRDQMEERAKALRASTTVARAEMKDEALKKRLEIAHKQAELVNKRIDAAIERVQTLTNRLSTSLDNLSTKGINVDASRAKLAEATAKLDIARAKAAEIKLATEATFASETPKDALKEVQALVKEGTTIIQEAHKNVAEAISLIKAGINKTQPATPEATVSTEASATVTQ